MSDIFKVFNCALQFSFRSQIIPGNPTLSPQKRLTEWCRSGVQLFLHPKAHPSCLTLIHTYKHLSSFWLILPYTRQNIAPQNLYINYSYNRKSYNKSLVKTLRRQRCVNQRPKHDAESSCPLAAARKEIIETKKQRIIVRTLNTTDVLINVMLIASKHMTYV
jgi:hypothetical protein